MASVWIGGGGVGGIQLQFLVNQTSGAYEQMRMSNTTTDRMAHATVDDGNPANAQDVIALDVGPNTPTPVVVNIPQAWQQRLGNNNQPAQNHISIQLWTTAA